MKTFLVFLAAVSFVRADDLSDAKLFLECCHKAMDEGIPAIPLPSYNPLVIKDFLYSGDNSLLSFKIGLTNNKVYDLVNYTFPVLKATSFSNPERVIYDYEIYWPMVNLTGIWEINIKTPLFGTDIEGTYNIVMYDVNWMGILNFIKPGQEAQGYNATVSNFTLNSSTSSVSVVLTGADDVAEIIQQEVIEVALLTLMNHFPAEAAELLRTKTFNDFWINHPERINTLLKFCDLR